MLVEKTPAAPERAIPCEHSEAAVLKSKLPRKFSKLLFVRQLYTPPCIEAGPKRLLLKVCIAIRFPKIQKIFQSIIIQAETYIGIGMEKVQFLKKNCIFVSETIGKAARLKFLSPITFRA